MAVGYCTLYGDMAGGLAVISDVPKTMVYELAKWRNRETGTHPRGNAHQSPVRRASRRIRTDQDSLPPYDVLDRILKAYVEDLRAPRKSPSCTTSRSIWFAISPAASTATNTNANKPPRA